MGRVRVTLTWRGGDVRHAMRQATARGLQLGAEHQLGESNTIVPLDEAALQRSGVATVDETQLRAAVSYDTPYAVPQHERLDYRHAPGRDAKYLEMAVNRTRGDVLALIAAQLRRALR